MRRHTLIVCTDARVEPRFLADAVGDVLAGASRGEISVIRVALPAVLPPGLPISARPLPLAERLERLGAAAVERGGAHSPPVRVEVVPCRSIPALLDAHWPVDKLVLVGGAGRRVRRSARGVAADVTVVAPRPSRRRRLHLAPAGRPEAVVGNRR